MASATEKELSELHSKVARQLAKQLENADTALMLLHDHRDDGLPEPVIEFLEKCSIASPALLTIAAKFLKDNDITCLVEDSKEMSDLEKRLAAKKERKAVGNVLTLLSEDE
jgi:hypothetical protein